MKNYFNSNSKKLNSSLIWNSNLEADTRILELAKEFRCRINFSSIETYQYDGVQLFVGRCNYSNIIHDLSHFIMTPKSRRKLPDYGLGTGPESLIKAKTKLSEQFLENDEELASIFGIKLEKYLGFDEIPTYYRHHWLPSKDKEEIDNVLKVLKTKKLIKNYDLPFLFEE